MSSSDSSEESDRESDISVSDSLPDSLFGSPDEDDDEVCTEHPPIRKPTVAQGGSKYKRFDPGEGDKTVFSLNDEMTQFASRCFTRFVSDKQIKETITEDYPVPTGVAGVEVPKVDEYICDIFTAKKQDYGRVFLFVHLLLIKHQMYKFETQY